MRTHDHEPGTPSTHFGDVVGIEHREAPPGTSVLELRLLQQHCNRHGTVHGGVLMTLLDAAGMWAGAAPGEIATGATVSMSCSFLRAVPLSKFDTLRVRGRFYTLDELKKRVSDWQNALELNTAHFLIRTDGPPERALDLAIDVERAYLTFYTVFGKPLELYVFDEVPEINVFSDPKDFRAPPQPEGAS